MGELGSLLVRAREARGLTIEDAERDTRISRRYLQALEAEQFDVIPAPVYARGFLRSYSQYLGIDPQETLAMFPRDEDEVPQTAAASRRPAVQQPPSAVGAARPTWRRPTPPKGAEASAAFERPTRPQRRELPRRDNSSDLPLEPVIGVDIGVAAPARRIKTDPAAQTRSAVIAVVAIAAVVVVILIAFLISNLGGGDSGGGAGTVPTSAATAPRGQATQPAATTTGGGGGTSTPGVMPNVVGQTVQNARTTLGLAGIKFTEKTQKSQRPKGEVIDQSPAADTQVGSGFTAMIIVSDGP